jgi:hypothetical protein
MFNRFFCFLLLTIVGLNSLSFNIKIKAADLQKPYISEVWAGDTEYSDKCAYDQDKINSALKKIGFCGIDFWIEIANPTSLPINLSGYEFDLTSNYITQTINATKLPTIIKSSIIVAPNSVVLFQTKYGSTSTDIGNFKSVLSRAGIAGNELNLTMPTNVNKSNFSVSFYGLNGFIDSFSSSFVGATASVQVCLDENGNKKQTNSTKSFQADDKSFYGTPGSKNDCPETKKVEIPVITPLPAETPPPAPKPDPVKEPQTATNTVSQVAKNKTDESADAISKQTILPATLPTVNIKTDLKFDKKKIEPVILKVEPETIPVQPVVQKPIALVTPAAVEVKKEVVQEIKQKPIVVETQQVPASIVRQNLTQPLLQEKSKPATSIQNFAATVNPSIVSQTKFINVIDEKQTKIFGVDVTKAATVDMHTIKVNFIYFDLAIILFLLTKTTLENKQQAIKLFDIARQKVFQSK